MNSKEEKIALRSRIVTLFRLGASISRIATECRTSPSTVRKWTRRYVTEGSLADSKRSGRRRKLSEESVINVVNYVEENRFVTLNEVQSNLNLEVSRHTIRRRLLENDIHCRIPATQVDTIMESQNASDSETSNKMENFKDIPRSRLRIPGALIPSYNKLVETEEGKAVMKRIKVSCGVCKATRFYSLNRGITKIAGVVSCELCRHFYQGFKRNPVQISCVGNSPGECYKNFTWLEKKCKACWLMQIAENCPISGYLYITLSKQLPEEMQLSMRGFPQLSNNLPPSAFGSLALEIFKEFTWTDVTEISVLDQQLELRNQNHDSDDEDIPSNNEDEEEEGEREEAEERGEAEDIEMEEEESDSEESGNGPNANADTEKSNQSKPSHPNLPTVKKFDPSKASKAISRKLANIGDSDELDEPDAVAESDSSQGNSATGAPSPASSSPAHSRSASPQLGTKPKPKSVKEREAPSRTALKNRLTRSDSNSDTNVDNGSSRTSLRTRRTRKHEKIDYFNKNDNKIGNRRAGNTIYGPDGRIVASGKDLCDCLQPDCPGCHFPCPKCRSSKCGKECRVNRKWFYEKVEMEGTKFFWTNAFIKGFN